MVQAALLGVVQGLTEFLPVSSTAHLLIAEKLIGYQDAGGIFAVMIQLGSVLAVVWLYRSTFLEILFGLTSRAEARRFALLILVAVLPSLVAGAIRDYPAGRVYAVVTQGYGLMPSYAAELPLADRWAVVAYVQALQLSQAVALDALPADIANEAEAWLR